AHAQRAETTPAPRRACADGRSARGPPCPGAASLGLRTEREPLHVVDVPIRLVDDFLALPSVEHGRDPLRSVDLRQDASSSGVAGGYTARVAAAARCHGFKSSISPCAALRGERAPTDASARATRERPDSARDVGPS